MRKSGTYLFFSILFLAIIFIPKSAPAAFFREERCAVCHIYDSPYFEEGVIEEKNEREREKKLCYSCHLGAVDDSRRILLTGAQHPEVWVERKNLRTGELRKIRGCAVCHTPHTDIGWEGFAGTSLSIHRGGEGICVPCHPGYGKRGKGAHHTASSDTACLTCHTMHGGEGKNLLRSRYGRLCLGCHEPVRQMYEDGKGHPVGIVVKRPVMILGRERVGEPEKMNLSCDLCHDMHREGKKEGLVKLDPEILCRKCHEGFVGSGSEERNNGNHPGTVSCTACHFVHKVTGKDEGGPYVSCLVCHSEKVKVGKNHPLSNKGVSGCLSCHSVHKGVVGTPNLRRKNDTYCLACHGTYNTLNESVSPPLSHPVFTTVTDEGIRKKIVSQGGKIGKFGEIICRTCHTVHRGEGETLLLSGYGGVCENCHGEKDVPHGSKRLPCLSCHPVHGVRGREKAEAAASNPRKDMCLKCHGRKTGHPEVEATSGGDGFEFPLFGRKGEKAVRGTITCPTCHDSHGKSGYESLLRSPYEGVSFLCLACHGDKEGITLTPHDLRIIATENLCEPCHEPHYGDPIYMWGLVGGRSDTLKGKLCLACHSEKGMAEPVLFEKGHPVDFIPSVKRGIPLPFFDTAWKENELGMVTCPTCHNVHGERINAITEQRQGLLNLMYRFGDDVGFIERKNFCTICHGDKKTMVQGNHGNIPCEECHMVHEDGKVPKRGRLPDLCLSCHGKIPEKGAFVFSLMGKEKPDSMRVTENARFIGENGRISVKGVVSCPSCHEVHEGGGKDGDNFIGGTPSSACLSCHLDKGEMRGSPHDFGEDNLCGGCHDVCRIGFPKGELKKLAESFGATIADGKCITCHSDMVGEEFSFVHPQKVKPVKSSYGATVYVGSSVIMVSRLPGSSSIEYPLFDQEGKERESGVLGCRSCHDPHGRNKIKERRTFFLRDTSGLFISFICQPCHGSEGQEHYLKFHNLKRKKYE